MLTQISSRVVSPLISSMIDQKAAPVYRDKTRKKVPHTDTKEIFWYRPKEKTYQKTFLYMSFASTKSRNGVKRKQNRRLVSSNNCFKLQKSPWVPSLPSMSAPSPHSLPPSLSSSFLPFPLSLSEAGQGPLCTLIGCGLMLSNNIPVP